MNLSKTHFLERTLATVFFTGYFPKAPGTIGSLSGLMLLYYLPIIQSVLFLWIVLLFFVGVWVATVIEKEAGKDAGIITIDECCGMWISLLFLPLLPFWIPLMGFVFFRLFDIWKPFPIDKLQQLNGGWGVMLDDVAAGILANLLLRSILIYVA